MGCNCEQPKPIKSCNLPPRINGFKAQGTPVIFHKVIRPATMGDETVTPPESLQYANVLLVYEASDHAYIYSSDGAPTGPISTDISKLEKAIEELGGRLDEEVTRLDGEVARLDQAIETEAENRTKNDVILDEKITAEATAREEADQTLTTNLAEEVKNREEAVADEAKSREEADQALEDRIEGIVNSPDVRYIVDTHADLEEIDKSTIGDQDYARVLQDEEHEDASTYYQFSTASQEWTYVGQTGPYYTKQEMDEKLEAKQDTLVSGENIKTINGEPVLGEGDIEIPSAKLYSSYGTNTDGAVTQAFINGVLNQPRVEIGQNASAYTTSVAVGEAAQAKSTFGTAVGRDTSANQNYSTAIGCSAKAISTNSIAIGYNAMTEHTSSVALGYFARTTRQREVSIGGEYVPTRFLANVTAGELDTDATNVAQVRDMISEAGGGIELLSEATYTDIDGKAYDAAYINSKLNKSWLELGANARAAVNNPASRAVALGSSATATTNSVSVGSDAKSSNSGVAIGRSASAVGSQYSTFSVAIGDGAVAGETTNVAIGYSAQVTGSYNYSMALGAVSKCSRSYEVSVGSDNGTTRYLANIRKGSKDTDAVNVAQLNEAVGNIEAVLERLDTGAGV